MKLPYVQPEVQAVTLIPREGVLQTASGSNEEFGFNDSGSWTASLLSSPTDDKNYC